MNYRRFVPYFLLLIPVLIVFGDTLFAPGAWVASHPQYDAACYYAPVRSFGFGEIARGHVPLWNPHTFSGTPFVAAFQSALYYPLNLHYLVLPLSRSLNIEIVLHVYLLGAFMFAWARGRGLSMIAALFTAFVVQYSGPYYLNVLAGHLSYLGALAWTPLAILAVDNAVYKARLPWAFVGATALTMSILAGHPQAVFCTVVVLLPYGMIGLVQSQQRRKSVAHLALILGAPLLMSAPQLWPAVAIAKESVRAGGLHHVLASSLSFPPENLLTFLAPSLFGDSVTSLYTGRWVFWETCAFMGIAAFSLAAYAIIVGHRRDRFVWLALAVFAALLALGRYTPLYQIWYAVVPVVDSFRCPSRHFFHATMFLAMLSGLGLDVLLREPAKTRWIVLSLALTCAALFGGAAYVHFANSSESPVWSNALTLLNVPGEVRWRLDDVNAASLCAHAAKSLAIASGTCGLLAALYAFSSVRRKTAYAVATLGVLEMLVFAWTFRATADLTTRNKPALLAQLQNGRQDARVFDMAVENYALGAGLNDLWGYDSTALLRYAQLIAYTQDTRAEQELTEFQFKWFHPLYAMMRCQFIIDSRGEGSVVRRFENPLPRAFLVDDYAVVPNPEDRYRLLADPAFNPRESVILETEPSPTPEKGGAHGTAKVEDESTDAFLVEVKTDRASVLLITDAYAGDWRAVAAGSSAQAQYTILPANHCLRAIPLTAGTHRIRIEYVPPAARWGIVVGILANLVFILSWILTIRGQRGIGVT